METALVSLFSIETIVFILVIHLIMIVFKKLVQFSASKISGKLSESTNNGFKELWFEWILLAAPSIFGGLLAFFLTGYPYPEVFNTAISSRVFFGMVCGLVSNNVYKIFKFYFKKMLPKD